MSALGLEEQRVRVILDLLNPPPRGLGHDYRVDVAITTWEGTDVLRAPSTALFRVSDKWCDGRARLVNLETGASDVNWTVIKRGLNQGDKVLPQPSDAISDGTAVAVLREVRAPG